MDWRTGRIGIIVLGWIFLPWRLESARTFKLWRIRWIGTVVPGRIFFARWTAEWTTWPARSFIQQRGSWTARLNG